MGDARNSLEGYLYNLRNTLEDEEKGIADQISDDDKMNLSQAIDEALDWMDENPEAEKEELDDKRKEVEQIANPIMKDIYGASGAPDEEGGWGDDEDDFDFGDDEL